MPPLDAFAIGLLVVMVWYSGYVVGDEQKRLSMDFGPIAILRDQVRVLREALAEAGGTRHTCTDPSGCDCAATEPKG